jgi:hypothetical protein
MKKLYITFACIICIFIAANAQPANDEPCNAVLLSVTPDVDECTPNVPIQWTAATATNLPNPNCAAGQLLDVWYKFVAPANGKVNIRVSTSIPANDGAMAIYNGTICAAPGAAVDCNDDFNILNPGFNLMGLTAGQTYLIRFWNSTLATGNFSICLSTPEAPPPPIDPTKKVGIGTTTPQANLDLNGNLIVRGGNPGAGKVLTAVDNKGTAEWRNQSNGKPAFKICLSSDQAITNGSTETKVAFKEKIYDVANSYSLTDSVFVLNDAPGSIYHFDVHLSYTITVDLVSGDYKRNLIRVYQNNILVQESIAPIFWEYNKPISHTASFDIMTLGNNDIIKIVTIFDKTRGTVNGGAWYGTVPPPVKNSCISGFKVN